jgi:predicted membrane protein
MSKQEKNNETTYSHTRNSLSRGFILVFLGVFFLLKNLDLGLPDWVLSWQIIMICIGLMISVMSNFKNNAGPVLVIIGGIFLAKDIFALTYDISRFVWPAVMIVAGIFIMFRRKSFDWGKYKKEHYHSYESYSTLSEDHLEVSSIFSGVNKIVVSKNFKGGIVNAVFGGCDINLTQADFEGVIEIEANCIFGGAEIVVPANWEVKVMITTVFGGVEDKRPVDLMTDNAEKTLIIKGSCIFGGVEIKSYK